MYSENLFDTVIKNDYCIGCGACGFVNSNYEIALDRYGMYKAEIKGNIVTTSDPALKVCPFSNSAKNEDFHAEHRFPNVVKWNTYIGKYINNYVGYVEEGEYRTKGSSGGFAKWILNELLETDKVDYVIQVVSFGEIDNLFNFQVFKKGDNILDGSKSAYYPVTLKDIFIFIKENKGRYAITAIPCFSKAIRNVCLFDDEIAQRVKFIVGIICGHLKSTAFAESLAWQLEVNPIELRGIEFRGKIEGLNANEKGVYATDRSGKQSRTESSRKLFGGDWGYGFFKYKACDYCDDVVGETADVSVGDAWIEELMSDHRGNNIIIVRNEKIASIIYEAINDGRLFLTEVEDEIVIKSQLGGIRHRREGLGYRIFNQNRLKKWVPRKRVEPENSLPSQRKRIYLIRELLRDASHKNFQKAKSLDNFGYFKTTMGKELKKLEPSLTSVIKYKIGKYLKKSLKLLSRLV